MELLGLIRPDAPLIVVALHNEAQHLDSDLPVLVTGVGKINSGQAVLSVLRSLRVEERPAALLNIGTAGALSPGLEGTHVIGSVVQHDLDGHAIERLTGTNPAPRLRLSSGPALATGDRFIQDETERDQLAFRADLVDMEGYAVADAARSLGIAVALVKHVSDEADSNAVTSWLESVTHSSVVLGQWLHACQGSFPVAHVQVADS